MAAEVSFPVRMRVGDCDESLIGTFTVDAGENDVRPALAEFLRDAADAVAQADITDEDDEDEGGTDGTPGQ